MVDGLAKKTIDTMVASMGRPIISRGKETWTTKISFWSMSRTKNSWQTIMAQAGVETNNPCDLLTIQKDTD